MVKLGDIAKKLSTRGKHSAKDTIDNGKYSLFSSSVNEIYKLNTFDYPETCCIVNSTNASGNAVVNLGREFSVTSDTFVFKCENDLTTKYLQLYLSNNIQLVKDQFQGANHKHPTWDRLASIPVPLPTLERQAQIVEAIDGWATLAQQEEVALKILEKQMMFQVKEMGRGQVRVKLGEVCELKSGFAFKSSNFTTGSDDTPVLKITNVNNGFVSFGTEADKIASDPKYTQFVVKYGDSVISLTGLTEGKILAKYTLPFTSYLNQRVGMLCKYKENIIPDYIYYYLLQNTSSIIELGVGSCQKNVSPSQIMAIEIPLPPLTEQQMLQSDFDEIRHKHAKIAEYKAKAQVAIHRLIPGAASGSSPTPISESKKAEEDFSSTSTINEVVVAEPVVAMKKISLVRKKTTKPAPPQ
jgi:type I restriction enzyme S subunit